MARSIETPAQLARLVRGSRISAAEALEAVRALKATGRWVVDGCEGYAGTWLTGVEMHWRDDIVNGRSGLLMTLSEAWPADASVPVPAYGPEIDPRS